LAHIRHAFNNNVTLLMTQIRADAALKEKQLLAEIKEQLLTQAS
jgi:hypothetical protein